MRAPIQFRDWLPSATKILGPVSVRRGTGVDPMVLLLIYQECRDVCLLPVRYLEPVLTAVMAYPKAITCSAQEDMTSRGRCGDGQSPSFPALADPVPLFLLAKKTIICLHNVETPGLIQHQGKDRPFKFRDWLPDSGGRWAEEEPPGRPRPPVLSFCIPQD
jgi:hypothetical protein